MYIAVNLLLFSSWYILLFRGKGYLSWVDRVLGTFVLSLAQIVITEMVLGIVFKKLFATPLFILNVSISLCVLVFAVVNPPVSSIIHPHPPLTKGGNGGFLKRGKERFLVDIFKELRDKIKHFFDILRGDWILLTIFVLFFISFCFLIFTGYLFPSYSWDGVFYHLPTIGFIIQSGVIENIPYNGLIYTFINVFPKNIDLFFLWNVIFLKSDVIVDLSQLPFTLAGMLALYSLAIKLKIKERYAVYSSLLFFFAPIIILQSATNYIDIGVSVLFLIAVNFLTQRMSLQGSQGEPKQSDTRCHSERARNLIRIATSRIIGTRNDSVPILLAGITSGLLLGSKGSGPLFIFALAVLFFINEVKRFFFSDNPPSPPFNKGGQRGIFKRGVGGLMASFKNIAIRYAVYFLIPVLLLGIYWYIQNWLYYNNPVYPFNVTLFGRTLFRGILTELLVPAPQVIKDLSPLIGLFYVWLERVEYYYYASELSGFGPLWFILFLPSIVFSVFYSIFKKRFDFLFLIFIVVFIFIFHPNNWTSRYVIFLLGLGSLSYGVAINYFEKREKILQSFTLLLVIYAFLVSNSLSVTPEKIKEFIHLPPEERTLSQMEEFVLNKTQRGEYGMWAWVAENIKQGDTLAYTYTPTLIGPLWNSSFSNKLVFIKSGSFENWIKQLEQNHITHILIKRKPRSMEEWWLTRLYELQNTPQWAVIYNRFRLEYSDDEYVVMRFR